MWAGKLWNTHSGTQQEELAWNSESNQGMRICSIQVSAFMPDTWLLLLTHSAALIHLYGLQKPEIQFKWPEQGDKTSSAVRNQNPILSDFKACVLYATESAPTAIRDWGYDVLVPIFQMRKVRPRGKVICPVSHSKQPAGAWLQILCLPYFTKENKSTITRNI